jgi:ubiquinone/menaquinone biosynthesis C-methylase UbiE
MRDYISFDHRADKYDNGFEGYLCGRFYRNLIGSVVVNDSDSVLDVGCGTGTILYRLSSKSKINGFGIDVSNQMLDQARKKCPQMTFQMGDSASLPFADNSFDIVTVCMAYHHFPDQGKFRQEAFRVLKSTGKLYICDPCFPWAVRNGLNGIFSLSKVEARFYTSAEIISDFQKSGFEVGSVIKDAYVQVITFEK